MSSDPKEQSPAPPPGGSAPVPSLNVQATMGQMSEQLQTVIDAAERAATAIRNDAEEQARQHLAEAQLKADRLTAQRVSLISELSDDLIRHATTVRDHSEQMVRALEEATDVVGSRLEESRPAEPLPSLAPPERPPASEGPAPEPRPAGSSGPVPWFVPYPEPGPPEPEGVEAAEAQTTPAADDEAGDDRPADRDDDEPGAEDAATDPEQLREEALLHGTKLAAAGSERSTITEALRNEYGIDDPEPLVDRILGSA